MKISALLLATLVGGGSLAIANQKYRGGHTAEAVAEYRRVAAHDTTMLARYDLGTALLATGAFDEARGLLSTAADADSTRATEELRFRAAYNAGNTDLEPVFRKQVPDTARDGALRRAIARYKQALRLRNGDLDAKWNLELAQRLLQQNGGGGGGGGGNGGGGGGDGQSNASNQPRGGDASPQATQRTAAEEVLARAENAEQRVQMQKLKKTNTGQPAVRDW
jgi:tetratricopeptide (TPR) repeat protein